MNVKMNENEVFSNTRRRPGPFGPAHALLPPDQQVVILDSKTLAGDAIERMVDEQFSQIPVSDRAGQIIGVFSWNSFGKRVADLSGTKIQPTELPIREAMEPARFIGPDVYIDTETDWGELDHVLVGTESELLGILCIADVFARLNDFAEAFVLLYEIEHEIRDVITDVFSAEELAAALEHLVVSASRPTADAIDELKAHIDEHGPNRAVGKALRVLKGGGMRPIDSLHDLTFSQYTSIVCSEANWPKFEPLFDTMRELIEKDFNEINGLRNVVFHFRRGITPKDTDRLRRFRDRLRYDRELYRREIASASSPSATEVEVT